MNGLIAAQQRNIRRLQSRIHQYVQELPQWGDGHRMPERDLSWEYPNVFALVGPRGAGKSSQLRALMGELQQPRSRGHRHGGGASGSHDRSVQVLEPIDCSSLPPGIEPGAAVLQQLAALVKPTAREEAPTSLYPSFAGGSGMSLGKERPLYEELTTLSGHHALLGREFRQLCAELATSGEEYGQEIARGMARRLRLHADISRALERLCGQLGIAAVVIPLDDFDLVPGDSIRTWMHTLLDEMHQRRLIFVLTADFERLEHTGLDREAQIDDKTGRALFAKLLPEAHRVELFAWPFKERKEFKTFRERMKSTSSDGAAPGRTGIASPLPLWCLLHEALPDALKGQFWLLLSLLPPWPRGLVDLYRSLTQLKQEEKAELSEDEKAARLLGLLASTRGETLLARQLKTASGLHALVTQFSWTDGALPHSTERTVQPAPGNPTRKLARVLEPGTDELPNRGTTNKPKVNQPGLLWQQTLEAIDQGSTQASPDEISEPLLPVPGLAPPVVSASSRPSVSSLMHDPLWEDPLRHDELSVNALRDALNADRDLWAEMLLNVELTRFPYRRYEWLQEWPLVRGRLTTASLELKFNHQVISRFFELEGSRVLPLLPWFQWKPDLTSGLTAIHVSIGWNPLLDAAYDLRDVWPSSLMELLLLPQNLRSPVEGPPDEADSAAQAQRLMALAPQHRPGLKLLPGEVRSILLLLDGLKRGPWSAYGRGGQGWELLSYIRLAALIVRGAFLFALVRSKLLDREQLDPSNHRLYIQFIQDSPLLGFDADDIDRLVDELGQAPEPLRTIPAIHHAHPLFKAAQSYFEAPCHRALFPSSLQAPQL